MEILLKELNNDFDESLLDFLSNLDKDKFDIAIHKLINRCYYGNNIDSAIKIVDFCEQSRIEIDPLPTITGFFLNSLFNVELLKWVTSLFAKEPTGYYLDIINSRNDEDALIIAERLLLIFDNITEEEWVQLTQLTENFDNEEYEEYENFELRNFLLAQSNNYAIYPTWLIKEEYPPLIDNSALAYPDNILNVENAVGMILDDLRKLNIGVTEIDDDNDIDQNIMKENLITQYAISTSQERILMLSNIVKIPQFDDSLIFNEYGPVNSCYSCSLNIDKNHECLKFGGCRMLLCNEYPEVDIFGEQIDLTAKNIITTDWFKSKCNQCNKKIRKKHHALRLPLLYGGWQGCYCSFECLGKNINNPIIALTVGRIKTQIKTIGINERI